MSYFVFDWIGGDRSVLSVFGLLIRMSQVRILNREPHSKARFFNDLCYLKPGFFIA